MKKMLTAIALAIAIPAVAHAQTAPAAAPKAAPTAPTVPATPGHNMQAMNCKDMHAMMSGKQMSAGSGQADHSKMDHSKMDHSKMAGCSDGNKAGTTQAPANPHMNHQR